MGRDFVQISLALSFPLSCYLCTIESRIVRLLSAIGLINILTSAWFNIFLDQDTILTVYYGWAMQRVDEEELEEGAPFPIWKLREMQKSGVQALI